MIIPPADIEFGDPAAAAVGQLNAITSLSIPFSVGLPASYQEEDTDRAKANGGIRMLIRTMEEATAPITLHVAGSCRDVSVAGCLRPELFQEKCRAIYLNAGRARSDKDNVEYNVELDPPAFQRMFSIPCDLYWMPCFSGKTSSESPQYGTRYCFRQREILPHLPPELQQYFVYALEKTSDPRWLRYIHEEPDAEWVARWGEKVRHMYCTGGFLHAAGWTVSQSGKIGSLDDASIQPVYSFVPIKAECDPDGIVRWNRSKEHTGRYIFRVEDKAKYPQAMTNAMRELLTTLTNEGPDDAFD